MNNTKIGVYAIPFFIVGLMIFGALNITEKDTSFREEIVEVNEEGMVDYWTCWFCGENMEGGVRNCIRGDGKVRYCCEECYWNSKHSQRCFECGRTVLIKHDGADFQRYGTSFKGTEFGSWVPICSECMKK